MATSAYLRVSSRLRPGLSKTTPPVAPCSCGLAIKNRVGQAYNEEAFRYFLDIERRRSELSKRPLLLLLADLKKQPDVSDRMDASLAETLFSGLWGCLRDTDFVGWYHADHVAGAVLTQRADVAGLDIAGQVALRVTEALRGALPRRVTSRLQVRVYQLPPSVND